MNKKSILLTGIGDRIGGVESFATLILSDLGDKYDFSILAATDKKIAKEDFFSKKCNKIFYLKNIFGPEHFFSRFKVMDNFFKKNKFDVVHINANTLNSYYIAKGARNNNIPVVYHLHNAMPSGLNFLKKSLIIFIAKITRLKLKKMNGIKFVSVSDDAGTDVYGNKLKYQVILNGLDTKAYRYSEENRVAYRNAFEISEKSKVGITVARLMPIKNYKKVLDICALGIPKYFDKFFIIGDGPEKDKIKKFIVENNLQGSVYLLGERTDINALLSMADFMLLTSFSEGLSISVLEAQAAGVIPIVSKGVPEITNITKKVKYLDISERDEVWLHTILEVLDEDVDRKNMNNILLNSQYSKASFLNQIEELYA